MKWHIRYLQLARLVSTWSKDPSTGVGAVIVRPDRTILSLGFNGFPRGMDDTPARLNNREEKYSRTIHAEINALLSAAAPLTGCTLYTWPLLPCDRCTVQFMQTGIARFIAPRMSPSLEERWAEALRRTREYAEEGGIDIWEIEETIP